MFVLFLTLVFVANAIDDFGPTVEVNLQAIKKMKFSEQWKKYGGEVGDELHLTASKSALKARAKLFRKAKKKVIKNNADSSKDYVSSINKMSFMTDDEKASYTGLNISIIQNSLQKRSMDQGLPEEEIEIEERAVVLYWPNQVTAIKNQGSCGSCWAFAAVAVLESKIKLAGGSLVQLSEQEVLDCNPYGKHCNGGWYSHAWAYAKSNNRLASSASYPYRAVKGTCKKSSKSSALGGLKISSYTSYTGVKNEALLATALNSGPMAIAVNANSNFMAYKSGIYNLACDANPNHAVVAIGYNSNLFLVRNSWGSGWGTIGHIFLKRGVAKSLTYYYCAATVTVSKSQEKIE